MSDERDRGAVGELEHGLGQLARLRVRPVRVLDGDDHRLLRGQRLEPADVGGLDVRPRRGRRRLEAKPQEGREGSERFVELVSEQRSESRPRLRPDRDLRLAELGSEPAEEDLDERPAGKAAVGVAVALEPRRARLPASEASSVRSRVLPIPGGP